MALSRRTFLKGAGAALALPWLEAMLPQRLAATSTNSKPIRLAALFMPNGVREDQWTPTGQGSEFALSPTLKPLEPAITATGTTSRHRDFLPARLLTNPWATT